jgi:hypothetical protein
VLPSQDNTDLLGGFRPVDMRVIAEVRVDVCASRECPPGPPSSSFPNDEQTINQDLF